MSNSNYDISYLKKYVNGELSDSEMYSIEREAQRDPMLADILMGIEIGQNKAVISDINNQIARRTHQEKVNNIKVFAWKRLVIAAAVVAVLGLGVIFFQQQEKTTDEKRTADILVPADVPSAKIAPQDSILISPHLEQDAHEADLPQIAENHKNIRPNAAPREESSTLSNEPSLHIKSVEEMQSRLNSDRPVFGIRPEDSAMVIGYSTMSKKKEATGSIMIRGINTPNNTLAGRVAGIAANQQAGPTLQVTVHDKETGLPISGVTIIQPNSKLATNTDAQGKATIQPNAMDSLVDIMAVGYNTVALNMRRNKNMNIKLQPSNAALEEVVVTTMSSRKTKIAEPVWGWKSFNNYIKKKTSKSRYEGTVRLSFYIDKDGFPTNINILQSANEYLDARAKEILLSGPKWTIEDYRYVTLNFEFTY